MLEKTMKSVLTKKINDWLSTITDPEVVACIKKDLVITGGCFPSLMVNECPKDYDVYLKTMDSAIKVARYYVKQFNEEHGEVRTNTGTHTQAVVITGESFEIVGDQINILDPELKEVLGRSNYFVNTESEDVTDENFRGMTRMIANTAKDRVKIFVSSDGVAGELKGDPELGVDPVEVMTEADNVPADVIEEEKKRYRPVFLSTNAVTLSDGIQIVVRFYGTPSEIHDTYDFAHTKAYFTPDEGIVIPPEVYECVHNKVLIYTGSRYPVCSVVRMRKFLARGWTINAGQILKMAMQISDLDLTNIDVLEDQLVGVDSLYFAALIRQFRAQKEKENEWTLSTGYVMSIIDKIF